MSPTVAVLLALVVLVVLLALKGLKIIRQAEVMLVERLGKFHRLLQPGINIIWPFIDRPRQIAWRMRIQGPRGAVTRTINTATVDLREQVFDFPEQSVITRDNVVIEVNGLLYYQVTDARRAVYEVANLPVAIEKLAQTTLRNIIGEMELDTTLSSRDEINSKMRTVLDDATDKWGVKVNRVELQDISPPHSVQDAMEKQMKAERERRAQILEAEGIKQSQVLRAQGERDAQIAVAEGDRQSRVLRASGEAEGLEMVRKALEGVDANAAQYQVALTYLDTLGEIGKVGSGDKTVFVPFESADLLGGIGGLRELLGGNNSGSGKGSGGSPPPLPR
ncbi:MAG: paraslipin [Planctomycetes bacterium]|nr:paraslipin [Planctomycetota bacterium]MCP4772564.1 paraslipin [Planctomycetota bacterium]MCP4860874.1 paraslipin [Planctomycetota bacterium]